jgi:hypothetical protein
VILPIPFLNKKPQAQQSRQIVICRVGSLQYLCEPGIDETLQPQAWLASKQGVVDIDENRIQLAGYKDVDEGFETPIDDRKEDDRKPVAHDVCEGSPSSPMHEKDEDIESDDGCMPQNKDAPGRNVLMGEEDEDRQGHEKADGYDVLWPENPRSITIVTHIRYRHVG